MLSSRSTAIDLLNSRQPRDDRRQHIQHQLDSLRFYDSVPLYDGLRRLTPAAGASSSTVLDQTTSRGDSPWPPGPPTQPRHASRKRLRRVASEPTDYSGARQKQPGRGIWNLAGSGRPSAAPRWPTTAETAGGLRPRHWPPANDRGPYWIRLESALTMTKPEDEQSNVDDEGRTFEYRVDVPATDKCRTSSASVNDQHHQLQQQQQQHLPHHNKAASQQQKMYVGNGHQCTDSGHHQIPGTGHQFPRTGHEYPGLEQLQTVNSHECLTSTQHYHYPTDRRHSVSVGAQQQYPATDHFDSGHRYPATGCQYPTTTQPDTAAVENANVDEYNGEGVVRSVTENMPRQQSYDRRHHLRHQRQNQCHHDASGDVIVTSPTVDPPRYELFTHV